MPGVIREPVPLAKDVRSCMAADALTSGIDMSAVDETGGKWRDVRNFLVENGRLTVRRSFEALEIDLPDGTLHGYAEYEDSAVMHIGTALCRFNGETLTVITDSLPDAPSVLICFRTLLYIYCSTHVYTLDTGFNFSEVFPYAPRLTDSMLSTGTYIQRRTDFEPNLVSPYVTASFSTLEATYHFPNAMDMTRPFYVECDGVRLNEDQYEINERGNLHLLIGTPLTSCIIGYACTEDDIADACADMTGCTLGTVFGGGTLDGTRMILAGSAAAKGRYFISAPADPLSFSQSDVNTVAAGTENITALCRQGAYLLIFTDRAVHRMSYTFDNELGGVFSLKVIAGDVGCAAPFSVCSASERTVFVSDGGVNLINSVDIYDTMNAVPVDACITGRGIGFGAHTKEDIRAASAAVCRGRYYLLIGNEAFVWDFAEKQYVSSSDVNKAARQLVWTRLTDLPTGRMLSFGGELFILASDEDGNTLFGFGGSGTVHAALVSPRLSLGSPHTVKRLTSFRCGVYAETPTLVTFRAVCDGVPLPVIRERIVPDASGFGIFAARLPGYLCRTADFTLETEQSAAAFGDIRIDYITLKGR